MKRRQAPACFALLASASLIVGCADTTIETTDGAVGQPILMEEIASLGTIDGPGALGTPVGQAIGRDSAGRYWVVSEESAASIAVFDSIGGFRRRVGEAGPGPGEFGHIAALAVGRGDTVQVFDIRNGRHVWLDPDGRVVRSRRRLGGVSSVDVAPDGRVAIAGGGAPGIVVQPVEVLADDGRSVAAFGADLDSLEYDFYAVQRFVTWAPDGTVWTARLLDYQLERWNREGEMLERWERSPDWMAPGRSWHPATEDHPPSPTFVDLHFDQDGRLWTLVRVGEPEWVRGLGRPVGNPEGRGRLWPIEDRDAVFGSRIEVLDVEARRVISSAFFSEIFVAFLGPGVLASYSDLEGGVPRIRMWRARVRDDQPDS